MAFVMAHRPMQQSGLNRQLVDSLDNQLKLAGFETTLDAQYAASETEKHLEYGCDLKRRSVKSL